MKVKVKVNLKSMKEDEEQLGKIRKREMEKRNLLVKVKPNQPFSIVYVDDIGE